MPVVRTHMSVTLDGYVAGPNQSLDKPFVTCWPRILAEPPSWRGSAICD